jgi:hypothetical protein
MIIQIRLAAPPAKPFFILPVAIIAFMIFGFGPNILFALLHCVILVAGTFLLWRPGEPQILLFLFVFQWLQLAVTIFYANLRGATLVEFLRDYPGVEYAVLLAMVSLFFLAIGIRLGTGRHQWVQLATIQDTLRRIPPTRWLRLHLIVLLVSTGSKLLAGVIPGLSQPLLALADMKWGTFLIFTIATFSRSDGPRTIWLLLFGVEFAMSLGGYFSSFKFVFLYTLIALTAIGAQLKVKHVVMGALVAGIMLLIGLYWTVIKVDYRQFVSGGEASQTVVVGKAQAIGKLIELASDVTGEELLNAVDELASRFSEIDMFSAVVTYVPSVVDHEWGKLWLDAILRPFMPRILFPSKAVIDESELTNHYTGLRIAGVREGTQISMGYIADSYIDFGEFGMMAMILLLGYFVGITYRWLINHSAGAGLIGAGLASATFIQLTSIGFSSAKLVGGIVVSLLIAAVLLGFVVPRYMRWLNEGRA